MFAPARMPVAEGKKMENMPKKLPSGPRQLGTKLAAKISAVEGEIVRLLDWMIYFNHNSLTLIKQETLHWHWRLFDMTLWAVTFVAKETRGLFLWWSRDNGSYNVTGKRHHDNQEEQNLGLWKAEYIR